MKKYKLSFLPLEEDLNEIVDYISTDLQNHDKPDGYLPVRSFYQMPICALILLLQYTMNAGHWPLKNEQV